MKLDQKLLTRDEVSTLVDAQLQLALDQREQQARAIDEEYAQLMAEIRSLVLRGGKRLRPYQAYLAFVGYGGKDTDKIWPTLAALELFHSFMLIHDDVMDQDLRRHNGPTIAAVYRKRLSKKSKETSVALGDSMAIVAGDLACGLGYAMVAQSDLKPQLKLDIISRLEKMTFETAGGQILDVLAPVVPDIAHSMTRLISISHYKTAVYSFEAPLQIGAMMAGAPASQLELISLAALPIGIAYQLRDDTLGLFGDSAQLGKPVLSDLRQGKRTVLMHLGHHMATRRQNAILERWLGDSKASTRQLNSVRRVLEECGAKTAAQDLTRQFAQEGLEAMSQLKITEDVRAEILRLLHFATERAN